MRTKAVSGAISFILALILTVVCIPQAAVAHEYTVDEVQSLIDGIVDYKVNETGSSGIDEWVNGAVADGAGTATDWYALALSQDGYADISSYGEHLTAYLESAQVSSAVTVQKYALALCSAGIYSPYIPAAIGNTGKQGIMSCIYGLHILNNGYTSDNVTADGVIDELLSQQLADGGWALWGEYGDIDVTSMTVSALSVHCRTNSNVRAAVDRAIAFLSSKQLADGGYKGFGAENPESAAQVLVALSAMGIDCQRDERFIKNGNTVIDGIAAFRLADGSFSHIRDGGTNETATVQAFYSLIAYKRMRNGKSPLLVLDKRIPEPATVTTVQTSATTTAAATAAQTEPAVSSAAATSETVTSKAAVTSDISTEITTSARTEKAAAVITETSAVSDSTALSETVTAASTEFLPEAPEPRNYKPTVIVVIIGAAGVLCLVVFAMGKRSRKNFIFIAIAAAAAIVIVLVTDVRTKDEYYHGGRIVKEHPTGTVTLEIRCDTIAGSSDSEYVPEDGVILAKTEFEIEEGETVYDILTQAARSYCIHVENKGSSGSAHGMVYIAAINYIYEFEHGDLSGWVYHVNGITPSRGCGEYVLSDGDEIQWLYTCELGKDLDEVYE